MTRNVFDNISKLYLSVLCVKYSKYCQKCFVKLLKIDIKNRNLFRPSLSANKQHFSKKQQENY